MDGVPSVAAGFAAGDRPGKPKPKRPLRVRPWPSRPDPGRIDCPLDPRSAFEAGSGNRYFAVFGTEILKAHNGAAFLLLHRRAYMRQSGAAGRRRRAAA